METITREYLPEQAERSLSRLRSGKLAEPHHNQTAAEPEPPRLRGNPKQGGQWTWMSKAAMDRIRAKVPDIASALAVYVALTRISSDERISPDQFETTQVNIAHLAGISKRTAQARLEDLQEIGLIEVRQPRTLGGLCSYRLFRI